MAGEAPLIVKDTGGDKLKVKSGGEIVVESGGTLTIESGGTLANAGTVAHTGAQTFDDIVGNDTSLGITGAAAASVSAAGGAVAVTGAVGGATSGVGGAVSSTAGAGGGTGAGGVASVTGGASGGGATGNGGNAAVTGGAAASTNGSGGSVVLTPGAKAGSGIAGGNFLRSAGGLHFRQQAAAVEKSDGAETITAAQMINGIVVFTVTTGRTLTTPTGAALLAGCPVEMAVGDSFDFTLITVGTGADDIATLTAGDGDVTFVGRVTVGPALADNTIEGFGTWRFRYMGANAFVGYRIG